MSNSSDLIFGILATLALSGAAITPLQDNLRYLNRAKVLLSGECSASSGEDADSLPRESVGDRLAMSLALECAGRLKESGDLLDDVTPSDPRYRRIRLRMGWLLERAGNPAEAARAWQPLGQDAALTGHFVRAAMRAEAHNQQAAERYLQAALGMAPDDCWARDRLLVLKLRQRRYDEAAELIDSWRVPVVKAGFCAGLAIRIGSSYVRQQRWQAAIAILEDALGANPSDPDTRDLLGAAFIGAGQNIDALRVLEEQVSRRSAGYFTYLYLGIVNERLGRDDGARAAYRTAVELGAASVELWEAGHRLEILECGSNASDRSEQRTDRLLRRTTVFSPSPASRPCAALEAR